MTSTWAHTFNAAILNEFRFGWNRSRTFRLSETSFGPNYAKDVFNLKNTTTQPMAYGIPAFNLAGFSGIGSISQAIGATDENFSSRTTSASSGQAQYPHRHSDYAAGVLPG